MQAVCAGAVLPEGYAATGADCAPLDPGRWQLLPFQHRDADGDGVGAPPRSVPCLGAALPAGFSVLGHDPDDADPAVTDDDIAESLLLELL